MSYPKIVVSCLLAFTLLQASPETELKAQLSGQSLFDVHSLEFSLAEPDRNLQITPMGPSLIYGMLIGYEIVVLAASFASRAETGAYIVGGFYGLTSLASISLYFDSDPSDFPAYMVLTAGTAALSWYNLTYAGSHSPNRKFWTNLAGANGMAVLAIAAVLITDWIEQPRNNRMELRAGPGSVGFSLKF